LHLSDIDVVSFTYQNDHDKGDDIMTFYVTPYHQMASMRHAMNHWFERSIADHIHTDHEMLLAVDVKAGDEAYDITALVPGLEADDLDIEVLNNTVTIRGEFKPGDEDSAKYLVCELPNGRFSRVINLPSATDASKVEASIKNGIITLHIPKAEADQPKSIKVKSN
jgi:HSP20 family protein